MVGCAFKNVDTNHEIFLVDSSFDLRQPREAQRLVAYYEPDEIIHLAAKVGGLKANSEYMADFFYDNIMINTNLLQCAKEKKVSKVVSLLSTCIYPDKTSYPLSANNVHKGEPHDSNFGYAYAKRMLDVHSRALRQQCGCNFITAVPNNLFGENDNFDLHNSHVIPAMIRKIYEAKRDGTDVTMWGDGSPLREFTYAEDIAQALLFLLEDYNESDPINIGNTGEISIKELARTIAHILDFRGKVIWDTDKPNGQHRKPSDNAAFLALSNMVYTPLDEALKKTCEWFIMNYPNVRGV